MRYLHPQLYIGPSVHPPDLPLLYRARITAVLSLQQPGVDLLAAAVERMRAACEPDIAFCNVAIPDHDPDAVIGALPSALTQLHGLIGAGRTVYVHCSEGINRAPSVGLAYLVCHCGFDVDRALGALRRCDPGAKPYAKVIDWLRQRPA